MKTSKKSMAALLLTAALVTTGLVGCSQTADTSSTTKDTKTTTTSDSSSVPSNNNQSSPSGNTQSGSSQSSSSPSGQTQQQKSQSSVDPTADDPNVQAVAKAFNIGGDYYILTANSIIGVAMGHLELPLNQKQDVALAKAMNDAMMGSGWKEGDPVPGLFLSRDGTSFDLGMKLSSGKMTLQTFQVQPDGTFKKVKTEVK